MQRLAAIALFGAQNPETVPAVLVAVAEAAFAFGPTTSFDAASPFGPVAWVDITGCAHLYEAATEVERERKLAEALAARIKELGVDARVAVADGPRIAAAVARHLETRPGADPRRSIVVPQGRNREAVRRLPLVALPAPPETLRFLAHVGLRTLGDLRKLPRASLGTRLGAASGPLMTFLEGDDRTPITPYLPPQVPEERAELEYGVSAHEALLFVVKALCDRMGPRLLGRAMGASRLEIEFSLDRALVPEGEALRAMCGLALPAPLQRAADLFAAIRARVESVVIAAPALAVTLRVPELSRLECRARDLFVPEAKAFLALPRLTAELVAELGEENVGILALVDTWVPTERAKLVGYGQPVPKGASSREKTPEPTRYLPIAGALPKTGISALTLVLRHESVAWWKVGITSHDYGTAFVEDRGLAWIAIDRATGDRALLGWMD